MQKLVYSMLYPDDMLWTPGLIRMVWTTITSTVTLYQKPAFFRSINPFAGTFLADVPTELRVHAVPFGCSVKLSWNTSPVNSCPISRYTVHYRESVTTSSTTGAWQITSLNNSNTNEYRLWLNCSMKYDVMFMAWNQWGHSDFNEKSVQSVQTDKGTLELY